MIKPKRIIHNGNATIVFWNDNTKTVVKCAKDAENVKSEKSTTHKVSNTGEGSPDFSIVRDIMEDYRKYMDMAVVKEVKSETVVPYTGLTDKNGKEIFEGDSIKIVPDYDYFVSPEIVVSSLTDLSI